jgi:hypothetical protein
MSESATDTGFTIQPATIDQAAGALALSLGALGSLLLVIWQSRCLCKCRIGVNDQCYLFDCSREPPPRDPESGDADVGEEELIPTKTEAKKESSKADAEMQSEPEPEIQPQP